MFCYHGQGLAGKLNINDGFGPQATLYLSIYGLSFHIPVTVCWDTTGRRTARLPENCLDNTSGAPKEACEEKESPLSKTHDTVL